ncbi:calmodulin-binding transcription activator [Rhynchospora pubera]|uniref:Calmodulin-binding transcription activator n=1 Tax=Rhynchospora pubera TaxID=906938 RepID=A0AAV8FL71_9POAL|nr:calmodulin-binding transcription activator [Rhynchospora pubera]
MVDSPWRLADARRYALNPQLDIAKIVQEAKTRWLRPGEICEIIRNYQRFQLTPDPPYKPDGGSLFLFDRKALRYFRKDGHNWRKKKDGKTVREAHEKLKCGSVDVLHCYYAHGENNENFQRRSYWMLDGNLEHIVLVHYRDINEPNRSSISSHTLTPDQNRINQQVQQTEPSTFAQASFNPNPSSFQSQQSSPVFEEDSGEELGTPATSLVEGPAEFNFAPLPGENSPLFKESLTALPTSIQNLYTDHLMSNQVSFQDLILSSEQQSTSIVSKVPFSQLATVKSEWADIETGDQGKNLIPFESDLQERPEDISRGEIFTLPTAVQPVFIGDSERRGDQMRKNNLASHQHHTETSIEALYQLGTQTKQLEERKAKDLNRLDSFGRWMSKEIGKDCDDSIMAATASDSCNYWSTLEGSAQAEGKEVISRNIMQLDSDISLGPSVSQDQLFSIVDFSPDWAYSNVETKVLISGKFLGTADPKTIKWGCMFGETEVPAEVLTLTGGAIRCFAPPCSKPGRVPFYVTSSNRLACSEIREFEFRATPAPTSQYSLVDSEEEYRLQVRLTNLLSVGSMQRAPAVCSVQNCTKCEIWRCLIKEFGEISTSNKSFRNGLIERLMFDRLIKWLGCKLHGEEESRMVHLLDGEGQGIIHLTGALGYDWALGPIVASGISPNFRDARGWTALHWTSYCGREETVVALVNIGADPAAVEDPTSKSPGGRTASDVASSRGHKGIAGFLAEAHLTSHLSSLNLKEGTISDNLDFPECALTFEEETDDVSLKGSLVALRNSVQAAAKIHTAFRVSSFRQREMREKEKRGVDVLDSVTMVSSMGNRLKMGSVARSNNDPLHSGAAVKIQQKYRGWKGRKEFLKIRDKIVKIQAHVRGHQVRKQYKRVVWSVSIVEKAVLRWRRKGAGLRGFRARETKTDVTLHGSGSSDEYDYLSLGRRQKEAGIERALSRVRSMARSSEGRNQYMRLVNSSRKAKLGDGGSSSSRVVITEQVETLDHSPMIQ